ncbi:MAG: pyridoxamine 5'-phosphate oxidase family protein [Asgard group archaeon]|nr:pyridoxamine 5'-phosphate oxidase family protein [Asgard group archaeon]
MIEESDIKKIIRELLASQLFCVLTTNLAQSHFPYSSLVASLNSDDLKHIHFATSRKTTKFTNLLSDPKVCMFFDNRSNELEDVTKAVTATVLGKVEELDKETNKEILRRFIEKYPQLKDFVEKQSTAFLRIIVDEYIVVHNFHKTLRLTLSDN